MLKPLLTIALALAATPAAAQASRVPPALTISYADLDLSAQAGRDQLDRRISQAVETLCPAAPAWDLVRRRTIAACRTHAWASVALQRTAAIARRQNPAVLRVASTR